MMETDETGTVMTGEQLPAGKYQLEEIKSPKGYLISETPVKFEVTTNIAYETLPDGSTPVITVKQKDTAVKGKVNIEKKGEVLVDYKDGKFVYEEKGLANAKYEIFAREDILDPSNDGKVIYKKGTVVDTITTNSDGKATSKELPGATLSVCITYLDENNHIQLEKNQHTGDCIPAVLADGSTATWVSTEKPHVIEGLAVGNYYLVENIAPTDYSTAESILFTVTSDGTILDKNGKIVKDSKIVMSDERIYDPKTADLPIIVIIVVGLTGLITGIICYRQSQMPQKIH